MRTSSFAALALVMLVVAALAFVLTPHERGTPSSAPPIQSGAGQR
jgi:hypothetical protein